MFSAGSSYLQTKVSIITLSDGNALSLDPNSSAQSTAQSEPYKYPAKPPLNPPGPPLLFSLHRFSVAPSPSHMYGQPPRSRPSGGGRGRGQPPPQQQQHHQQLLPPNPLLQNPNFYFQNPHLQLFHQNMAFAKQIPGYPMQNAAFPIPSPSFPPPQQQQLPNVAPPPPAQQPQVRPQVPSHKELVERTERAVVKAWRDLVAAGESVSACKVSQATLLALQVDSWGSLGFQMQEVPALHRLMATEGKVM
ncbi:hypothetical protein BT93_L1906 [Corymbia citriodora subsp. variegata]|uniref:Uncharacterized protein n=1 Tax=Corymbia citriodora subsp. variegata TaxID=360336 RepID=A0A8T0CQY2_CORYI|nr:hypothetical protein BT93_L1906 [Corymbia citriodora subsp. variegata]